MNLRTLTADDFDALHACFNEAFSDYVIPMNVTREQLASMFTRRGWVPAASVAAFDGEAMIGFVANCVRGDRAYNSGTGTVPSHRRGGIARELMLRSIDVLTERGATSYQLEVIARNSGAVRLYRTLSFAEVRTLDCWSLPNPPAAVPAPRALDEADRIAWEGWWNVEPSWQNSTDSIRSAAEAPVIFGDDRGCIVVFPETGDVPQLAVNPQHRRRGIGRSLVAAAALLAGRPLRFINVDASDDGITSFLTSLGATRTVTQLEMIRPL